MTEVGRLFNNNELIVAEVLQSAEAMKAAVNHLEQFMEKADTAARGKIMLATVKGDVHDIGKNLVEIILANNGYDGDQPRHQGAAGRADPGVSASIKPDAIGLSGLLVKSAQQMVITATDLKDGRHRGAAAGGRRGAFGEVHAHQDRARPMARPSCYAKDAMTGLAPDEPADGPGERDAVLAGAHVCGSRAAVAEAAAEPLRADDHAPQPQSAHRHSDSAGAVSRPQGARRAATWPRCGATSIRSCCTAGTWATRAISRRTWRSTMRRRWSCSTTWRR